VSDYELTTLERIRVLKSRQTRVLGDIGYASDECARAESDGDTQIAGEAKDVVITGRNHAAALQHLIDSLSNKLKSEQQT